MHKDNFYYILRDRLEYVQEYLADTNAFIRSVKFQDNVEKEFFKDKILLYPNPSKGTINIKSTENINQIKIYSVLGKLIYSEKGFANLNEYSIDLANNGLYYVAIFTENGVLTEKITIQKYNEENTFFIFFYCFFL